MWRKTYFFLIIIHDGVKRSYWFWEHGDQDYNILRLLCICFGWRIISGLDYATQKSRLQGATQVACIQHLCLFWDWVSFNISGVGDGKCGIFALLLN